MQLGDNQEVVLSITPGNDAAGQPGNVPADLAWSVDNGAVVSIGNPTAGSASVTAVSGTPGTATITASSTEWATPATFVLDVVASDALSGTITAGTPTAKAATPTA